MKCFLGISSSVEDISRLSHSTVFLYFLHCPLKSIFLSLLSILWNSDFSWAYLALSSLPFTSLLFSAVCKASSDNHFAFLHFFCFGMVLVTTSCAMFGTSFRTSSELYIPDLISLIKNDRMISVCFQGKPFNIMVIQVYAPTTNAEEAEQFFEDQ